MLSAALAVTAVDWMQTRKLTNPENGPEGKNYFERNPALNKYPSNGEINRHFLLQMAGTTALAFVLPQTYRRVFLGATLVWEIGLVANNHRIGLRASF